jgi:cytochrome b6-f complex iron-sulfur subunit
LLACIEIGWLTGSILKSRKAKTAQQNGSRFIDGGRVDSFKPGDVKAIPEAMLYLSRLKDGSFMAISKTCTHLGCTVPWDHERQQFVCPCHGSTFDRTGSVLTAPAIRPLDYYPVRIENGMIRIDVANPKKREAFDPSQTTPV